jgi:tetratricopeptide (TPR) repeat protein
VNRGAAAAAVLAAVALAACATSPPLAKGLPHGAPSSLELAATPFFPQEAYQCGPAALATVLGASGVASTPESLTPQVFIPGRRGSLQLELVAAARRHGRLPYVLATTAHEMIAELADGRPVLVLQNLGAARLPVWHYAVLIGYDATRNVALLRSGTTKRLEMRWQRFAASWHRGGRFAFTTLVPGDIPAHAEAGRYIEAAAGLESAGQRGAAAAAYDAAIVRWPREPHAWLGRGNVAYAEGDLESAAGHYVRAIRLAPGDAAPRNNLAQVLIDAGCVEAARRQLERAMAFADDSPLAAAIADTHDRLNRASASGRRCRLTERNWPD